MLGFKSPFSFAFAITKNAHSLQMIRHLGRCCEIAYIKIAHSLQYDKASWSPIRILPLSKSLICYKTIRLLGCERIQFKICLIKVKRLIS